MVLLRFALTPGEPAGIGPDLCVQLAQTSWPHQLVIFADPELLRARAKMLKLPLVLSEWQGEQDHRLMPPGELLVYPVPMSVPAQVGTPDVRNAQYVLETLTLATQHCQQGKLDALITAPVHKGIINDAGIPFTGHTEFLETLTGTPKVVMMLATEGLRVALVTTHIPLAYVSKAVTSERLEKIIHILHKDLVEKFAIEQPTIYVCGLNPHAGEDGVLGREEIDTITPTLEKLRQQDGINLIGPLPADTIFNDKYLQKADAVLGMYHDQVLPVLKYKGFGRSVNITLGLPFIRTSVDHGTALDLAATGTADIGSFRTALAQAIELVDKKTN